MMPRKMMVAAGRLILPAATVIIMLPTSPPFMPALFAPATMPTRIREPTKLPTQTMTQFFRTAPQVTLPDRAPVTIRLLPVNSSAPATTTRIRPREKQAAPPTDAAAKPRLASDLT